MIPGLCGGRPRRTLSAPTTVLKGVGLHSGADASVRVLPAAPGAGRLFRDLDSGQEIPAHAANGQETARCTVLRAGGCSVQTVEHLLSALTALGIDDCVIETCGGEIPASDGSAAPFLDWLRESGVGEHAGGPPMEGLVLSAPRLVAGEGGVTLVALPAPHFRATVVLDYADQPWIGTQAVAFDAADGDYARDVAPARTFGFVREIEALRTHGLALGASRDNALALGDDGYEGSLRFPDELVRHKLLDLIGDLALVGRPVCAHVIAVKPSHSANLRLARLLTNDL